MELREALDKAKQILDEERRWPTVRYVPADPVSSKSEPAITKMVDSLGRLLEASNLSQLRAERPRQVLEDPRRFVFRSVNYDLLCALVSQLRQEERPSFVHSILLRIILEGACARGSTTVYPNWNAFVSELPLLAEFAVRNGGKEHFFRVLAEAKPLPEHVILLKELEDMIALNYRLFSDGEYEQLAFAVENFRYITSSAVEDLQKAGVPAVRGYREYAVVGKANVFALAHDITTAADGIIEQCRKARYLYLKGSLVEGLNLEVNQDKDAVESSLAQMGFSGTLVECLNKAESLYHSGADAFDLKSSMGHLRSFMESLHAEGIGAIVAIGGTSPEPGWGSGLAFLRQSDVLTHKEERLAAGLYGVISDEAVHPLITEREYARLARNMVVEYGLLFLRKLEKLGLRAPAKRGAGGSM